MYIKKIKINVIKQMTTLVDTNDNTEIRDYFQKCLDNMYQKIKDNNLTDQFLNINIATHIFKKKGFMFSNESVIREIERLTDSDGHSGASFGCCCRNVYHRLIKERKQQQKAKFRGLIRAIIILKKLRLKTAQSIYIPGGKGFLIAQRDFNQLQN